MSEDKDNYRKYEQTVTKCQLCPNIGCNEVGKYVCVAKSRKQIGNMKTIPTWCPLPKA